MSADQGDKRSSEAKNGVATTLLAEAIEGHLAGRKALTGRQLGLFNEGDRLPDDDRPGEVGQPGKAGRPPGARNKATEAFRQFVRERYGDPLVKLMERAFADPITLAKALGPGDALGKGAVSPWEVARAQAEWLLRLMPYMHSAMPAELKVKTEGRLAVAIGVMPGGPAGDRVVEGDPLEALYQLVTESQQNQGLTATADDQLHVGQSHASPTSDDVSKG